MIACFLPFADQFKVFIPRGEVAESWMVHSVDDSFLDGRHNREVHIRHPHRDDIKAFLTLYRRIIAEIVFGQINRDGIIAFAVNDGCKIILHVHFSNPNI